MNKLRPFITCLHANGYKNDGYIHETQGCPAVSFYKKTIGLRVVDVHLSGDGDHTASHFYDGSMNTPPTNFKTVAEMAAALKHEETRTDNNRYKE